MFDSIICEINILEASLMKMLIQHLPQHGKVNVLLSSEEEHSFVIASFSIVVNLRDES